MAAVKEGSEGGRGRRVCLSWTFTSSGGVLRAPVSRKVAAVCMTAVPERVALAKLRCLLLALVCLHTGSTRLHCTLLVLPVQVLLASMQGEQQPPCSSSSSNAPVLQALPKWLSSTRQDLERALARVAAGTAAPSEAVGLWTKLAQVGTY